ncbi:hypothetical protein [Xanthocytophaga flava]|uniref:hypothetical protein n=1 Tax=Xanthocytophaga flava TaxID=3048013 RepID=UPI0028D0C76A|nr:hypothetical protein [Xanthocytophaga flavus]MDJ1469676.1 hypothetical protein [Xanthocytophaga flavus]
MDHNAHSPIARCLEKMQYKWEKATASNPSWQIACWQMGEDEAEMLNAFCQIESSVQGSMPELFVVLLTPFQDVETFSADLIKDWLKMWVESGQVSASDWGFDYFSQEIQHTQNADSLLIELLNRFYQVYGSAQQPLVLGLIPRLLSHVEGYTIWIKTILPQLHSGIRLMVVEQLNTPLFKQIQKKFRDTYLHIPCGDLNVAQALEEAATSGDPNQPEIQFRQCLFQMGKGTASNNQQQVEEWGEKALLAAQKSGSQSMMATAYLVYAGFLMHFEKETAIQSLLDRGIQIARAAIKSTDPAIVPVLLQLYGYKSAWYSMSAQRSKAAEWMSRQGELAQEHQLYFQAMLAYYRTAALYKQNGNSEPVGIFTQKGYQMSLQVDDEILKTSDFLLLGNDYYEQCRQEKHFEESDQIHQRLTRLYGLDWQELLYAQSEKGKYIALQPQI